MGKQIRLENLIDAGIIKPEFRIHVSFRGRNFFADVDGDGFVLLEGRRHTSLSMAGGIVRAMVSGPPQDGKPYRRVNGWDFWSYTDDEGKSHKMDELRQRYRRIYLRGKPGNSPR